MISDRRALPWQNTLLDNMGVVEACRRGGLVRRFHTHPLIIGQTTVAEHTFNMLCLCMALHPSPSEWLLFAILTHDIAEAAVGDVPSPAKWANEQLRTALDTSEGDVRRRFSIEFEEKLSPEEMRWLRFFDYFEGAMFARDQIVMGNVGCQIVFELYMTSVTKLRDEWNEHLRRFPADLDTECRKLCQHYVTLTGEHFPWPVPLT